MEKVAPSCIWPDCPALAETWPETKLCIPHLTFVLHEYEMVLTHIKERRGETVTGPPAIAEPELEQVAQGVIYFVQVGGHIKIGWTSDLAKRMRSYPPNATLLASHPGPRKDELHLHKMFAAHRSHGREWYPLAPVILEHIKRVVAEHGPPIEVGFGAKPVEVPQPRKRQHIGGDGRGPGSTPRTVRG